MFVCLSVCLRLRVCLPARGSVLLPLCLYVSMCYCPTCLVHVFPSIPLSLSWGSSLDLLPSRQSNLKHTVTSCVSASAAARCVSVGCAGWLRPRFQCPLCLFVKGVKTLAGWFNAWQEVDAGKISVLHDSAAAVGAVFHFSTLNLFTVAVDPCNKVRLLRDHEMHYVSYVVAICNAKIPSIRHFFWLVCRCRYLLLIGLWLV